MNHFRKKNLIIKGYLAISLKILILFFVDNQKIIHIDLLNLKVNLL